MRLTNEEKNYLFENSVPIDDVTKSIILQVKSVKVKTSLETRQIQNYINELANFNSNPESINYIGETLVGISVFLSNQHTLNNNDVNRVQNLIKEILQEASEEEITDMGSFDPIFNLSKILDQL